MSTFLRDTDSYGTKHSALKPQGQAGKLSDIKKIQATQRYVTNFTMFDRRFLSNHFMKLYICDVINCLSVCPIILKLSLHLLVACIYIISNVFRAFYWGFEFFFYSAQRKKNIINYSHVQFISVTLFLSIAASIELSIECLLKS